MQEQQHSTLIKNHEFIFKALLFAKIYIKLMFFKVEKECHWLHPDWDRHLKCRRACASPQVNAGGNNHHVWGEEPSNFCHWYASCPTFEWHNRHHSEFPSCQRDKEHHPSRPVRDIVDNGMELTHFSTRDDPHPNFVGSRCLSSDPWSNSIIRPPHPCSMHLMSLAKILWSL